MTTPDHYISELRKGENPRRIVKQILNRALGNGQFDKSIRNCHTPGVDSISLFHSPDQGMIRFYYAHAGKHVLDQLIGPDGHFSVGVHNHKYPIAKIPLVNSLVNVRVKVDDIVRTSDQLVYEYGFRSAIKTGSKMRLEHHQWRAMSIPQPDLLLPGDAVVMEPENLHTVVVSRDHDSVWLVIEGPEVEIEPLIYSPRSDLSLSPEGLYEPMDPDEAREITKKVWMHVAGIQYAQIG